MVTGSPAFRCSDVGCHTGLEDDVACICFRQWQSCSALHMLIMSATTDPVLHLSVLGTLLIQLIVYNLAVYQMLACVLAGGKCTTMHLSTILPKICGVHPLKI